MKLIFFKITMSRRKRAYFFLIDCLLILLINLKFVNSKNLINGNYSDYCDGIYFNQNNEIFTRGHQLLVNSTGSSIKYLLVNNTINIDDCIKKCCNDFDCNVAFFNHSTNVCLHLICDFNSSDHHQCPPTKDAKQSTSFLQIRSPSQKKSKIKYSNELSRDQLINQFGLIEQNEENNKINKSNSDNQLNNNFTITVDKNPIIQLPNNSITIKVSVKPSSNHYIYKWTLVSKPQIQNKQDSASISDLNTDSLKLNDLIEGSYIFNVTVSLLNNPIVGEESVNITVLPRQRINKPPIAVIKPQNSIIQLPKKEIFLDGSQSIDDDKIVNYKWQIIKSPIDFKLPPDNLEKQTLELNNLLAGNYTFELIVTDSNNQSNSTEAELTVLSEQDYPPKAIVTKDQIVFLPQNNVTLMGNESVDDKKIISYDWKLIDENGDNNKQMSDITGSKTPFLTLSNLKVGVYKALLTVTDSSNQTSTAETHIFVKSAEVDVKPEAIINPKNQIVYMPFKQNITLDGSSSKDVSKNGIIKWKWSQIDGPRQVNILNPFNSTTNLIGLTPGRGYEFLLEITNSKNLSSNATTTIDVIQNENDAPIADAGQNQTIILPADIVILNGSRSRDDLIDLKYNWIREPNSLAIGDILNESDKTAILKLANLIEGQYIWRLTVEDSQGLKSSDLAFIEVKSPKNIKNFVEVLLNVNYKQFRYDQEIAIQKKLEILLSSNIDETIKLNDIKLYPIHYGNELVLMKFTVQVMIKASKAIDLPAIEVVKRLRLRLRNDKSLIDPEILSVKTSICQNSCSNHGTCDERTKFCHCDTFWIMNLYRFYYGDGLENCDWSIIYVILFSSFALMLICTIIWSFLCFFVRRKAFLLNFNRIKRRSKARKPRSKYTLLKHQNGFHKNENQTSDDSDSEIDYRNKLKRNINNNIETKIKIIKNANSRSNFRKDSSSSESEIIEYDYTNITRRGYS